MRKSMARWVLDLSLPGNVWAGEGSDLRILFVVCGEGKRRAWVVVG